MTVIRPNSVSGITSITAQANEINFFRSNGALAGLQLNGVNFNTTTGVSTFNNLDVGGVLTYQDVTNVDSLGIGTFRTGINVSGGQLDVGSNIKLGNAGVITATSFSGSGANLTGIDTDLVSDTSPQLGGNLDTNSKNIVFGDSSGTTVNRLTFGGQADMKLYHDGTNSVITNATGDLYINNNADTIIKPANDCFIKPQDGENGISVIGNGAVSLYYDNSRKFFTQNLGCTVESTGNTPELTFRGASDLDMGKIDVDQFTTNYSMMRFFTLSNGSEIEYMRLLDNGSFCVGGMIGSSNNNNIQSPGQGNGNTNIGCALQSSGRVICNSAGSFSSFGRNGTGTVISFTRQGGDQGAISVAVGSVSYGSGSDYRLKENVVSLTDGITRVKQLVPKRFNFIEDTTNTLRDGFLAHEVSSIVPEAITGTKDAVDSDNNPVYQQIDQAKLVPLLTAALKEAITKIETLETKVAALEGS